MIKIENLSFSYGKMPVINNLSWQLETGQIHGLVGLNGAGKTTLFNLLSGQLKPSGGSILFNDQVMQRQACGFMETNSQFYPMITGQEYLDIFRLKNPEFDFDAWNRIFKLPLKEVVENYSTGMQKRLSLMGIISLNREILILDEPFNGLDFEAFRLVQQIVPSLAARQKTIIISSHIPESLTPICNSISLVSKGNIAFKIGMPQFDKLPEMIDLHSSIETLKLPL
ncbi:MAG: ATP-binding cassette domain-containing protein [Lentimicrobium sp.]